MLVKSLFFILLLSPFIAQTQSKVAYQLYNARGKKVNYDKMLTQAKKADFICFGEFHNNPIAHWLELELAKDLHEPKNKELVIAMEMIEADNQTQLDSFLKDEMIQDTFEKAARLWPNYDTDYKPLVLWAKENKLPVIASNIPRRYASQVFKRGMISLDSLSEKEKAWMMPLPVTIDFELKTYKDMMAMMPDHQGPNFPSAQAVKDATMAWKSIQFLSPGKQIYHVNGTAHSDWNEGILWYVQHYKPGTKTMNIACRSQDDVSKLDKESLGAGDFILVIPNSMTTTY